MKRRSFIAARLTAFEDCIAVLGELDASDAEAVLAALGTFHVFILDRMTKPAAGQKGASHGE